jgi:hypothetical protein
MTSGYIGVSWFVWAVLAAVASALLTTIQIPKQTPHTAGLTHLTLRWFHSITWFLLALSFLLRGLRAGPPALADLVGIAGLGTYLAFLTTHVLSSRSSSPYR